jgi:hypothetical protein
MTKTRRGPAVTDRATSKSLTTPPGTTPPATSSLTASADWCACCRGGLVRAESLAAGICLACRITAEAVGGLVTDAIIQPMPELDPEELDSLRAAIAANGVVVPVVKDQHGRIIDGNHRAAIAAELGIDYPAVTVTVADDVDAWDRAVSLNCARRHLNREQTRELIRAEIQRKPDESDRAIARQIGCSPTTVGAVRADLREWAENITKAIRKQLDDMVGRVLMAAVYAHKDGVPWSNIAEQLKRETAAAVPRDEIGSLLWGAVFTPMFDGIRSGDTDCGCRKCAVDRWEAECRQLATFGTQAPEVSNLDSGEVSI